MALPPSVKNALAKMPRDEQKAFKSEYGRLQKSTLLAYLAWLLLGWHYLYMGRVGMQFAFWFTVGGLGFWWLLDVVRVPGIVAKHNEELARHLMSQHKMIAN